MQATTDELMAALPQIQAAPKTDAPIDMLCWRPGFGKREFVDELTLTVAGGIPGDRGQTHPWMKLPDGTPDPRIQVSILSKRVLDLVWRDRENVVHPGDPIIADLDTSEENLPVGTRLKAGTAILEVSDVPNPGCVKWKVRYGAAAKDWLVQPDLVRYRLRGVLCRIVQDGVVARTDRLIKL